MGTVGVVVAAFSDSCGLFLFFRFGVLQGIAVFPKLGGHYDLLSPFCLEMRGSRGRTSRAACTWDGGYSERCGQSAGRTESVSTQVPTSLLVSMLRGLFSLS